MAEDYIFDDRIRDAHQHWDLAVHLCAIFVNRNLIAFLVRRFEDLLQFFELLLVFLVHKLEGAHSKYRFALDGVKPQFEGCFCLRSI